LFRICECNECLTIENAIEKQHLQCFKYILKYNKNNDKNNYEICILSSSLNLDFLKSAHENGCPWDEKTCSDAAYHGHLDCLKYAHENE